MGRRVVDVATGAMTAAVVFGAVPTVLVAFVGVPLPHHWSRPDVVSAHGLFDALAVVAWLSWAMCTVPLVRSVARHVRRRDTTAPTGARLVEQVAVRMAAAVLALAPVGAAIATTAGAAVGADRPPAAAPAPGAGAGRAPTVGLVPTPAGGGPSSPAGTAPGDGAAAPSPLRTAATYTVGPGDSLWSIAERAYGDGADWPAIAAVNLGRVMAGGSRFVDPSLIRPGWILTLPAVGGTVPAIPVPVAASGMPGGADRGGATGPNPAPPGAAAAGAGAVRAPGTLPGARSLPGPRGAEAATATAVAGTPASFRAPEARAPVRHRPGPGPALPDLPLPSLAALGFGAVTAGLLARRARQSRRLRALLRSEGSASAPPSDAAAALDVAVAPFDEVPLVDWVELANRHLAAQFDRTQPAAGGHRVQVLRAGPDGVEVRLLGGVSWAPSGWERTGPSSWRLPAGADPRTLAADAADHGPLLPLLAPVGEDDGGTWLLPLVPGSRTSVLGPEAETLVAAMRLAAGSWGWREDLVITTDPVTAATTCAGSGSPSAASDRPVLFVGDPDDLPTAVSGCALLTTRPLPGADVVVVVDREVAAVHPLGLTLRPHLLRPGDAAAAADLVGPPPGPHSGDGPTGGRAGSTVGDGPCGVPSPGRQTAAGSPDAPAASSQRAGAGPAGLPGGPRAPLALRRSPAGAGTVVVAAEEPDSGLAAGSVEVRLLVAVPRIDGLRCELPANRARRAVELVAYLALHRPEAVTGDRLRTRVLGSGDADAAAKTLFNTAGAARRALGADAEGEPLLPPATRTGRYRLSAEVTLDVTRAAALVRAGLEAPDPTRAAALLRQGLALVDAEPLSGLLTGYAWWRAEGHERRLADLLVDGACRLARDTAAGGRPELAWWAIDRARLVEPYSEALARAAMEAAAAAGDAGRLHREWTDCVRMVGEVDPGGFPSEETERLYAELRRRVSADAGTRHAARALGQ